MSEHCYLHRETESQKGQEPDSRPEQQGQPRLYLQTAFSVLFPILTVPAQINPKSSQSFKEMPGGEALGSNILSRVPELLQLPKCPKLASPRLPLSRTPPSASARLSFFWAVLIRGSDRSAGCMYSQSCPNVASVPRDDGRQPGTVTCFLGA